VPVGFEVLSLLGWRTEALAVDANATGDTGST
jgi:hypothetical protein